MGNSTDPAGFRRRMNPLNSAALESSSPTPQNCGFMFSLSKFLFFTQGRRYSCRQMTFWTCRSICCYGPRDGTGQLSLCFKVLGSFLQSHVCVAEGGYFMEDVIPRGLNWFEQMLQTAWTNQDKLHSFSNTGGPSALRMNILILGRKSHLRQQVELTLLINSLAQNPQNKRPDLVPAASHVLCTSTAMCETHAPLTLFWTQTAPWSEVVAQLLAHCSRATRSWPSPSSPRASSHCLSDQSNSWVLGNREREKGAEAAKDRQPVVLINKAHQHEPCMSRAAARPCWTVQRAGCCGRGSARSENGKSPWSWGTWFICQKQNVCTGFFLP